MNVKNLSIIERFKFSSRIYKICILFHFMTVFNFLKFNRFRICHIHFGFFDFSFSENANTRLIWFVLLIGHKCLSYPGI